MGEQLDYGIAQTADGRLLVIQADRLDPMQAVLGPLTMLASIKGADLIGTLYTLPLSSDTATVIHSHHVGTDSGTGLVHMAPVHGHEDYETFRSAGILPDDVVCPVDGAGCFDASLSSLVRPVVSEQLVGLPVLKEGNEAVIRVLAQGGLLIKEQRIKHRYPYDWKTKTPVIIRWVECLHHLISEQRHNGLPMSRPSNRQPSRPSTRLDSCPQYASITLATLTRSASSVRGIHHV